MAKKTNFGDYLLKEVTCLGWCGRKRFLQKFPNDRYCTHCAKVKANLERNLSRREITLSNGVSLPEGVEMPVEEG